MELFGKGMYMWKIPDCEDGDAGAIAAVAEEGNLSHVLIKIADGTVSYNYDRDKQVDLVPPVLRALKSKGLQVWGWQYVYGRDPVGEARKAIQRIKSLDLDGYVIDAEGEYKAQGMDTAAKRYVNELRDDLTGFPIALSSYRYPSYHPQFPWREFLEAVDLNMPQVYWMKATNPAAQLNKSVKEFQVMTPYRPIYPTGAAFAEHGWATQAEEVQEFLVEVKRIEMPACNFWSWDDCRSGRLPDLWPVIRDYDWPGIPVERDICWQYIDALNTHKPGSVAQLYAKRGVHITAERTVQGRDALRDWYRTLLVHMLPGAVFNLTGYSGTGSSRHLTWTADSSVGRVLNGSDTFGLLKGKIAYHYTFFTITD